MCYLTVWNQRIEYCDPVFCEESKQNLLVFEKCTIRNAMTIIEENFYHNFVLIYLKGTLSAIWRVIFHAADYRPLLTDVVFNNEWLITPSKGFDDNEGILTIKVLNES